MKTNEPARAPDGLLIAGRIVRPAQRESGHWLWLSLFGWHDCTPFEDRAINDAQVRESQ